MYSPLKSAFSSPREISDPARIRITGLDLDPTQPSQEAPGFRRLYLKLSVETPWEWLVAI